MDNYIFIEEITSGCDASLYLDTEECLNDCFVALVDTTDKSDPNYPEGLHVAHLCVNHIIPVILTISKAEN